MIERLIEWQYHAQRWMWVQHSYGAWLLVLVAVFALAMAIREARR